MSNQSKSEQSNISVLPKEGENLPAVREENKFSLPMPMMVPIGKSGKAFRMVQHFVGERKHATYKDIRETLKASEPDLKGNALTKRVNEEYAKSKDAREQLGLAAYQNLVQQGYVPDKTEATKNGAVIRFVKPRATKGGETTIVVTAESVAAMTPEQKEQVLQILLAEHKKEQEPKQKAA